MWTDKVEGNATIQMSYHGVFDQGVQSRDRMDKYEIQAKKKKNQQDQC